MTSKFMTSQPGKQAIVIAILTNISRSKGNQAMKFGQSTEYKTRSIFEKKKNIYKIWQRVMSRPFSKK